VLGPQRITVGPTYYNVKSDQFNGGAVGDGVADDTLAIQAAENTATVNGGTVFFPPGIYAAQGIVKMSNPDWLGTGTAGSILKLKSSAATGTPLVIGQNFASLTGTTSAGGITNFRIARLMFDGNKANNGSFSVPLIQWFGYGYDMDSFGIINANNTSLYSEWGTSGLILSPIGLEARIRNFWIGFSGQDGIEWAGPHDSMIGPGIIAGAGRHSFWSHGNGGACAIERVHCWGASQDWSWFLDTNAYLTECQGEDGTVGAVWCRADGVQVVGGQYFSTPIAFRIGISAGHASVNTHIRSAAILGITSAAVDFGNDGGGNSLEFYTTGSNTTVASGTQSANTLIKIVNSGAGGAPNSTYTHWTNGSPGLAIRDTNPPSLYFRHAGSSDVSLRNNSGVLEMRTATPTTPMAVSQAGQLTLLGAVSPGTPAGASQSGQLFMGSGAPSNANGNNGDFYLRTDTTATPHFYKKITGSWTTIV